MVTGCGVAPFTTEDVQNMKEGKEVCQKHIHQHLALDVHTWKNMKLFYVPQ